MPIPHNSQEANQTIQYSWVIHRCLKVSASLLYKLSMLSFSVVLYTAA
jgi:hypothetical protein